MDHPWGLGGNSCGAIARFHRIGAPSLWFDEGYTAWLTNHPPAEIIRLIRADTAPPLYYLLLHGWCRVFGRSEAALRGLSAALGVAGVPLVALIARRTVRAPAAVVAAAWLFALSFFQTWYSREARAYELASFVFGCALYATLRHLERPSWRWLLAAAAGVAVGLYVNNMVPLYAAGLAVAALLLPSRLPVRRRLRDGALLSPPCAPPSTSPGRRCCGRRRGR